jgi:hypothetical protein
MPPLQIPDAQTLPQCPQFAGSDCMSTQYLLVPDPQIWPGGQHHGGTPLGGVRKLVLLSATIPGGQQSFGSLLKRAAGQQSAFVPFFTPVSPAGMGIAHFCPAGQHF